MFPRLAVPFAAALALGACTYPDQVTSAAPSYPSGYQPVMAGQATFWPDQPGAQWGPEDVPAIDVFYQPLNNHGRWVDSRWGQVFVPNAAPGWRPYANGQWLENRFWLSGDPWGWATDHYGRWGHDDQLGWVWVPGTTWGPSWVAWREADEVVGWAPIPPQVQWNVGTGFGGGAFDNWNSWYGPSWLWVPRNSLFVSGFGGGPLAWNVGQGWWGRSRWQHSPYWGWNQPWTPAWGWQAPAWAWNNWSSRYPQWSNWGWNRPGWHRPGFNRPNWNGGWNNGWNGGGNRPGWNGNGNNWYREPRRGQPGSVGDRIGRDMTGQPPRGPRPQGQPPQGWTGRRADGRQPDIDGDGRPGGNRGQYQGDRGNNGGWNGGGRQEGPNGGGARNRGDGGGGWNRQGRPVAQATPPAGNSAPIVRPSDAIAASMGGGGGRRVEARAPASYQAPMQPAYRAPAPSYSAPPPPRSAPSTPVRETNTSDAHPH